MRLRRPGQPAHELSADYRRSDDCEQIALGCVRASGCSPVDAVRVNGAALSNRSNRCARPEELRITRLPCIGRSSVGFGHTSRRRFGEDAQ